GRREARPLDDHRRAAPQHGQPALATGPHDDLAQVCDERPRRADEGRTRSVVVRVLATPRPVDELVADDHVADVEVEGERAGDDWGEDPTDTQLPQRPDVRAAGHPRWGDSPLLPPSGEICDPLPADLAHADRRG